MRKQVGVAIHSAGKRDDLSKLLNNSINRTTLENNYSTSWNKRVLKLVSFGRFFKQYN
jgi:hypothetical protein